MEKVNKIVVTRLKKYDCEITGNLVAGSFCCCTLELADRGNKKGVSCIPTGCYKYKVLDSSASFNYRHIEICDVPGRSGIKIHRGNFYSQIKGCILVGEFLRDINGDKAVDVVMSKDALEKLIEVVEKEGSIYIN